MPDLTAREWATLAARCYSTPPTFGDEDSASRAHRFDEAPDALGFTGTDNLESLIHDFEFLTEMTPRLGRLHAGIWRAYLPLRPYVLEVRPSVLFGHSLGAALAQIAAADLCMAGCPPSACYAFEPPKICGDDIMRAIFQHYGTMVLATRKGNDLIPCVPPVFARQAWPLAAIGTAAEPFDNLTDHEIAGVVASL